jgi:ribosomal protein S18 acetylase RimI-like enzyme
VESVDDTFEIRRRRDSDLPGCLELLTRVHESDGYPRTWPKDITWIAPERESAAWVCVAQSDIAGHISLQRLHDDEMSQLWCAAAGCAPSELVAVSRLFVDPSYRHRHCGRLLMDEAVSHANQSGLRAVLAVAPHNRAAIDLYVRMGFSQVGVVDTRFASEMAPVLSFIGPAPTTAKLRR